MKSTVKRILRTCVYTGIVGSSLLSTAYAQIAERISLSMESPTMLPVPMPSWGVAYKISGEKFAYGLKGAMNLFVLDRGADSTTLFILPAYSIGFVFEYKPADSGFFAGISPGFRHIFGNQGVLNPAVPAEINSVDAAHEFSIKEIFAKPYLGYRFSRRLGMELGYYIPVYDWNIFKTRIARPELPENNSAAFQAQLEESRRSVQKRVDDLKVYYLNFYISFVFFF